MKTKNIYELTNPQKSIWYMEEFYKGTSICNICGSLTINQKVDFDKLEQAIRSFILQNKIFSLKLCINGDMPQQYFSELNDFPIEFLDIDSKDEIQNIENEMVNTPFNPINSLLFKIKMFKLQNGHGGLVLNCHHIIADACTFALAGNNIAKIYYNLLNNIDEKYDFPSYLDYINSEKAYLLSDKFKKDEEYWNSQFSTIPDVSSIPSSFREVTNYTSVSKRESFVLPKSTMEKIRQYCSKEKISPFNFFIAIYSLYISRVSNLDEVVIGTPILNRTNFKEKNTCGMFISNVPLKICVNNDLSFADFVSNIAKNSLTMLRHQKYPYQYLLENLRKHNPTVPNLYDNQISYQITKANDGSVDLPYEVHWTGANHISCGINIHLHDNNDSGNLIMAYDYLVDKYSFDDINSTHDRILTMINQVLESDCILLKEIEIVTPEEKHKILYDFNNTKVDYPKDKTIVDLFEEQVEKTPDNIAVVFEEQKLTYRELNEKANSLARFLTAQNVKPGTVIGLRLNKRLEMIIGILAIIKSGCCYLPINMQYPKDRVDFMLIDSNAKLLLGTEDSLTDMEINLPKIDIDLSNDNIYSYDVNNLGLKISPEDLIYIIYTSGSTGKPKGAMLCHRNVVRLFKNDKFLFNFDENDAWTMFHSVAFDFSVWEMYGALLFGGKLVLVSDEVAQDPELFLNLMRKEHVTVLNQTPTYFYKLLKVELEKADTDLSVRYIIFGGEALKPNLIKGWYLKYPETKLINMYGITETTVHVTFKELSESDLESSSSNIGVPIPTLHVIVMDKNLKLLPFGTMGEMCVLGEGVFKGYLNREDLNKTKLIKIPEYSDKLIYRSGDTAIMHKDGHLEYMGRIDTQIKIRGFRVELGEIEEKILKYSNIDTCIVTKKIDESGRELLCAYYIKNGPLNISALRILLNKHLPSYMVPQYFIEIDKVPININGKTDFKSLPLPQKAETGVEMVKPRNEIDKKLLEIYKKFLHIENIGINDSFFNLGGDSLVAISISINISNELNINVSVKDILENETIANLSDYITNNKNHINKNVVIEKVENAETYPLSSAQKRMFLTSKMDEELNLYNITGGLILDEMPDIKKLENAINTVIKRHENLRTYFEITNNGEIVQKVKKSLKIQLNIINEDLQDIDEIFYKYQTKFNLTKGPLFNTNLIKNKNGQIIFMLDVHHIIFDGSSLNIFLNEMLKIYNNEQLEDLEIDYKDFAIWENKRLKSNEFNSSKEFWKEQFADEVPILNMPIKNIRPIKRTYDGNMIVKYFSKEFTKKITKIAKERNVTPYMIMLTAYYVLLYKYTGQEDLVVGTAVSGRKFKNLENLIGMFVNSLPLRQNINSKNSFIQVVNDVKNYSMNCFEHQDYPFDELVNQLNLNKDASRNPLFDVMFIYQNNLYKNENLDKIKASYYIPKSQKSKMDLTLEIIPMNNKMRVSIEYWTELFDEDFIKKMLEHYCNIIEEIIENPEIIIKDIKMLNEKDRNKIIYEFNQTNVNYDKTKNVTELFETIAKKMPEKTAVIFEDKKISYKELNEKANKLANYIKTLVKNSDAIIGIMLPRSIELVYTILAVRKLGMCFVPIDYTYPKDRIVYMLEESNAQLVITNTTTNNVLEYKSKLNIDEISSEIDKSDNKNIKHTVEENELAYIIYTSGSTGKPKGVKITNTNLLNLMLGMKNAIDLDENKTMISLATICFDMFEFDFWGPLANGLTLVLANEEEQNDPSLINELCCKHNVNIIETTPSKYSLIFKEKENMKFLEKITDLLVGGEQLDEKLFNIMKEHSNIKIYNMYGPTETTVWSTSKNLTKDSSITIGKPIANTKVYVLDNDLNITSIGVAGELCIAGDGVGKGYLNRQDLTDEKYIKNPFIENSIMYRTGDMCKFDKNGNLYCLGRIDNQVKIRGLRIELDEIEKSILSYPNIDNCIISSNTDTNGRQFIVAYLTVTDRISTNKLRTFLKELLPHYMVPSYFMILEKMPYLKNGKVNKKALPKPKYIKDSEESVQFVAPSNKIEFELVNIFQSLLGIYPIGIYDNFFELGGDSLLAMQLQVSLLKINYKITYADIFMKPTVKDLAEIIINNSRKNINYIMDTNELKTINSVLKDCCKMPEKISKQKIGNILLAGSTGFLGIHVLKEFLDTENGKAYCIIRSEPGLKASDKLKKKLHFYFGNIYDEMINDRIIVIDSEITSNNLGLSDEKLNIIFKDITSVVNCAAKVTHYGNYNDFKIINVTAVDNMIKLCMKYKKKLYQISTESVSGKLDEKSSNSITEKDFKEDNLYIKQNLDNVYARSKFEAEKSILINIPNGLNGFIFRMGNLTNRYSDGKFQSNIDDNAFVNRLNSYCKIGFVSNYISNLDVEMTPIDEAAKAVLTLMKHKLQNNRIFHLHNHKYFKAKEIIEILKEYKNLDIIDDNTFTKKINTLYAKENSREILSGILQDIDTDGTIKNESKINIESNFSVEYLSKIGFEWSKIDTKYLKQFVKYFIENGYFM